MEIRSYCAGVLSDLQLISASWSSRVSEVVRRSYLVSTALHNYVAIAWLQRTRRNLTTVAYWETGYWDTQGQGQENEHHRHRNEHSLSNRTRPVLLLSFLPRKATRSAVLPWQVVRPSVRPSVCPSVTLRYRDHIGWNSAKIISRLITLTISLSADSNMTDLLQREHPKF